MRSAAEMAVIEAACVGLLLVAGLVRNRGPGWRSWLADAPLIAVGAWLVEDSAIRLYGFYQYADGWHLQLDRTPLLIPVIWMFVVLSIRDVARELGLRRLVLASALLVWFDASFIEPIATAAGLWSWSRGGAFGVPWIGTLGWGLFAACTVACLERLEGPWRVLTVLLAPAGTHLLLVAGWWGLFRWLPELGEAWAAALSVGLGAVLCLGAARTGRAGRVGLWALLPRIPPAVFFLVVLAWARGSAALWVWALAFVPPWLTIQRLRWTSAALPGSAAQGQVAFEAPGVPRSPSP